jgi:transposase
MVKLLKKDVKIEITEDEINKRIDQIESANIDDDLRAFMLEALQALVILDKIVGMKETTIARLRKIFNKKIEKFPAPGEPSPRPNTPHPRGNNKGKNGQNDYPHAQKICHLHQTLKEGDQCPDCTRGKLQKYEPGIYIRISGNAPLKALIHETEKFRCNACLKIFEAEYEGKEKPKYDEGAHAVIAMLKYGASVPFYRLEKIQKHLHTPMPASTQWDLMENLGNHLYPVWLSLLKMAAEGNKFFIDDTKAKVLALIKENKQKNSARKGIFTTGLISKGDFGEIILYLTGRNHAGENIDRIIKERKVNRQAILMSDALAANNVSDFEFLRSFCLAHGRRRFFDLNKKYEEACEFVLTKIKVAYANEKYCKEYNLNPRDRLDYHQKNTEASFIELKSWCEDIIKGTEYEPNSDLCNEIKYLLKHWEGLTSFLRIEGAELDNNQLEQKLRLSVLNRKNWLFFKTELGALIGDIICSFIKTCEASKINPIEYFIWVMKNKILVKDKPDDFLPWKFLQIKK